MRELTGFDNDKLCVTDPTLRTEFQIISAGSANLDSLFRDKFYIRFLK